MASLNFCVSCKCSLDPPNASFCSQCGSPQSSLKLCMNCKVQLPPNALFCVSCGWFQTHPQNPDSSMKLCIHCKAQLHPNATLCKKCGKTQSLEFQRVPCILCNRSLRVNTQNCSFCSAPQDPEEFKKQSFKECLECGVRLLFEAKICHNIGCFAYQGNPILPTPSVTINLDVKQLTDDKGDTSDGQKSIPELQPQPSDQSKEEQCKSQQDSMDFSVIPLGKIFVPLKRSGDDETESDDKNKKLRMSDAAAATSGAVVQQKVNTYGIEGESATKSLDGDHQAAIVDTRKRKKADHDDSQGSFTPPLAKKVEDDSHIIRTQQIQADPNKLECNDKNTKEKDKNGQENQLVEMTLPNKQEIITNQTDPSGSTDLVGPSSSTPSSATPSLPALVPAPIVSSMDPVTSSASATLSLNSSLATVTSSPAIYTSVTSSLASVISPSESATGTPFPNLSPALATSSSNTTIPTLSPSSALVTLHLATATSSPTSAIPSTNSSPTTITPSPNNAVAPSNSALALVSSSPNPVTSTSAVATPSPTPSPNPSDASSTSTPPTAESSLPASVTIHIGKFPSESGNVPNDKTDVVVNDRPIELVVDPQQQAIPAESDSPKPKAKGGKGEKGGKKDKGKVDKQTDQFEKKPEDSVSKQKEPSNPVPNLPETPLFVLNQPKEKSMKIIFCAVIHLNSWHYEEGKSSIYLRFAEKELGDWKTDIGPCNLARDAGEGFHVVKYKMTVDCEFMRRPRIGLCYKYVVYSPKMITFTHQYEKLHGAPHSTSHETNRLLKIPQDKLKPGVIYRHFDTMIFPDAKAKVEVGTVKKFLLSYVPAFLKMESNDPTVITVPTPLIMRSKCMEIHLEPKRKLFTSGKFKAKFTIQDGIDGILGLFEDIYVQFIEQGLTAQKWCIDGLKPHVKLWFEKIISELFSLEPCSHRLISGLILACCLKSLKKSQNIDIEEEYKIKLIQVMTLSVSDGGKELDDLLSMIRQSEEKQVVIDGLNHHLKIIGELKNPDLIFTVLKSFPLMHFLCDLSKPNHPSHLSVDKVTWGSTSLKLLHFFLETKTGFIKKHYDEIKELFQFDSKMLTLVPYICPQRETSLLCEILPIDLAIVWLIERLGLQASHTYSLRSHNGDKKEHCFEKPMACIMKRIYQEDINDFNIFSQYSKATFYLVQSFDKRLNYSNVSKTLVELSVSLFIHIFYRVTIYDKEEPENRQTLCKDLREQAKLLLKDWVVLREVIGGSFFGGNIRTLGYQRGLAKEDLELKFWENILALKFPCKEMKNELEKIVAELVNDRVTGIPSPELKIDLFVSVEHREGIPDFFRNIFLTKAIDALDDLFSRKQSASQIQRWDQLVKLNSARVVELIAKILEKRYPNFIKIQEVPFCDLLEWELWPGFLKVYYAQVEKKEGEWALIVTCAISQLDAVCDNIYNGDITVTELRAIKDKQTQMNKLCEASNSHPASLQKSIAKHVKEFQYFEDYKNKLLHFLSQIGRKLLGQPELMTALQKDFQEEKISTLCVTATSDGNCNVVCFPDARPLDAYLDDFYTISSKYPNDLFNKYWKERLDAYSEPIPFSNVDSFVWRPVLQACQSLLDKLESEDMTLLDVDYQFNNVYFGKLHILEQDLLNLQKGVCAIKHIRHIDNSWIKKVVKQIREYWDLCGYRDAAEAFLNIRDTLNLTGDFTLVERVAQKVSAGNETLNSIDHSVVAAGKFLAEYATHSRKRECLQAFADCQKIVNWIREETEDVTDLVNFVTVALATAAGGEGDMTTDKLSFLRTVGSGFGPLIYKLPKAAGYQELQKLCRTLWVTLETAPNLPKMMRTCEEEIEWYKSVKETQGSVEVTSYGQMNNINDYGVYEIGSSKKGILVSRSEGIRLRLRESKHKRIPKLLYNLDELRDLESKLVLITGTETTERKQVDLFLDVFHSVCRITDVLIELQQHGNDKYIGWTLSFSCTIENVITSLQEQASTMENDLQYWKQELTQKRDHFYELNYFTTPQLLSLREELGHFKNNEGLARPIKQEVMTLLQSISREISSDLVKSEVQILISTLAEQEYLQDQLCTHHDSSQLHVYSSGFESSSVKNNELSMADDHSATPADTNRERMAESSSAAKPILERLTTSSGPQPKLTDKDLTDNQIAIIDNLKETYGFSKKLVLLAFDECPKPDIEEAVIEWCLNFDFTDSDAESETATEKLEGDTELSSEEEEMETDKTVIDEINAQHELPTSALPFSALEEPKRPIEAWNKPAPLLRQSYSHPSLSHKVTIIDREPISEDHPVVTVLVDSGFTLKESLAAAERYPNDVGKAMASLMEGPSEAGELFPPVTYDNEFERHDSIEEYERQSSSESNDQFKISSSEKASAKNYLSIFHLGMTLQQLSQNNRSPVCLKRPFPEGLKAGEYNLLVTPPDKVFKTVLSLYMESKDLPLPTFEEVLICNENTTDEEVALLWKRAVGDPNHFRIFCLVHAELLSYQVCDKALKSLHDCTYSKRDYKLVIVCSDEDIDKSHMISKLQFYKRQLETLHFDPDYSEYLKSHFVQNQKEFGRAVLASTIDREHSRVRVVTSDRTGMGKSLYIQRMKEKLSTKCSGLSADVIVPVHGPKVTCDSIVHLFRKSFENDTTNQTTILFHLDISPNVLRQVDSVLFSLLILQAVSDSQGRIWRCYTPHLYTIEVTVAKSEIKFAKPTVDLLQVLPTVHCLSPRSVYNMLQEGREDLNVQMMDDKEFRSPCFQRVYQYLKRHITFAPLDRFSYTPELVEGNHIECLQVLLKQCGVKDPSWSELKHFVEFLNTQLESCENSIFCNEDIVGDVMSGLKTFVVKFMIRMSKDFATSSLKGEVAAENQEEIALKETLQEYQIDERKQWEQSYHPYLFFNEDCMSITFVGFNVTRTGDLMDPVKGSMIESGVMTPQLHTGLQHNQVNLFENYQSWEKGTMIAKIGMVMGLEWRHDPDPTYVLTIDNVIKIMAIHMRFRCNIPVVIMGETGCGKTRLIRFMCDLTARGCKDGGSHVTNMLIMKVHGGTSESDVIKKVEEAEEIAAKNRSDHEIDTVLFFDEANTSDAIGLIKEVMCDRRVNGRWIDADVKFIAACNPYRKHTAEMIIKLESAGLGFFVKATHTQQKLGTIPLRQLVYRVLDLPPSMRPLVYDFGQLNNATEKDYTRQIVKDRCHAITEVTGQTAVIKSVANVLAWSQKYMRARNDECSFVSLRDVERAMIVFKYFCQKKDQFSSRVTMKAQEEKKQPISDIARALILSVSVCYHARLQDRDEYENGIVRQFTAPLAIAGREQFCNEIRWCQDVLLDDMKLGDNIARNVALRENVFMMAICIELRIPLFLVGKPGSSKSLAKSIVAASMLGKLASEGKLMKEFKEVHMFSYQCSQLSTPESVIEVFNTAKSFQKKQDLTNYVSVVVLDEVGLAEDSPNLPLKALHPLLEDGTEGADNSEQIIDREERVAFIGISNWALDPAKMNRGVMVTRGDPDEKELELSAKGICSNRIDDPVKDRLDAYFQPLSAAYKKICDEQAKINKSFFGLRDFYSLIKMLYWMCEKSNRPPTGPQLQHAIKRNFGGLENFDTYEIFRNYLPNIENKPELSPEEKDHELLIPDCSPLGLIRKSLQTKETSWHGENRYLLFLTENYAALQVIRHFLHEEVGLRLDKTQEERSIASSHTSITHERGIEESPASPRAGSEHRIEPYVLFGSSFPKDREYTQVCRNINQIKICMETGRTVILLNLENLYESLYDLLNQYYITLAGGQRYVDLGLQTHRVKCRVHNDFKLILIAEKSTVYEKFPTPLINRLEKHFVLTETVLQEDWQRQVHQRVSLWVDQFSSINHISKKFTKQDAFVGYHDDTPSSVIFQATEQLHREQSWRNSDHWNDHYNTNEWKRVVLIVSKKVLLQMASPDALIRLHNTSLSHEQENLKNIYFNEQCHGSIVQFLQHHLHGGQSYKSGLLIQVTTHSHLLSSLEVKDLCFKIEMETNFVSCFLLQEFDTEMDFSNKISPAFTRDSFQNFLLIIQCDSGHLYGDLLACARYRIDDERAKIESHKGQGLTHVLFIIHLPRQAETQKSSFVGFQGGSWISAHIDDIRAPSESALTLDDALSSPISQLFYSRHIRSEGNEEPMEGLDEEGMQRVEKEQEPMEEGSALDELDDLPILSNYHATRPKGDHTQCCRLRTCVQATVAKLVENDETRKRWGAHRLKLLLHIIPQRPTFPLAHTTFYGALVKHIKSLLKEREQIPIFKEWVLNEALSTEKLQNGGTFQNVLTRRFDEVVIPLFADILLFVDHYSNLNLLKEEASAHIKQLWLSIFSNEELVQFSYESYSMGKGIEVQPTTTGRIVGGGGLVDREEFVCHFPFFWLIKDALDSKLETVNSSESRQNVHIQLCEALSETQLATILDEILEENRREIYLNYLEDVLRSIHHVPHHKANDEFEILTRALDAIIAGPDFAPHKSLVSYLAAVHVVYHSYQQEMMWFGQLTTHIPGILVHLKKAIEVHSSQYLELPLHAVSVAIKSELSLPLKPEDREYIPQRLVKLQLCQNAIDSIITIGLTVHNEQSKELCVEIKCKWQHARAIQMFVEHIVTKFATDDKKFVDLVKYGTRIEHFLKNCSDFTQVQAIQKVQKILRSLDSDTGPKNLKYSTEVQKMIRGYCKSFFMEVVSSLCFGQTTPPEPQLIEELLKVVFTEKDKTKELTYSDKERTDKVPVIRSFLLQLLLEHNTDAVKQHLEEYFERSRQVIKDDCNLCLLCIQCFEDAIHKKYIETPLQERVKIAYELLKEELKEEGTSVLSVPASSIKTSVTLPYLEGIAKVRYSLIVTAELLYCQYTGVRRKYHSHESQLLIDIAKTCCTDYILTENDTGPGVFLVKQLARQYGFTFLNNITSEKAMQWVVPESLRQSEEEEVAQQVNDPFVIYENYGKLRACLTDAVYGEDLKELTATISRITDIDSIPLLVGVYGVVTCSDVYTAKAKRISDEAKKGIYKAITQCKTLKRELMWTAKHLIEDSYCGSLEAMTLKPGMSPQNRLLIDLVIHTAIVVQSTSKKLLTPFNQMINSPAELKGAYMPTMPEDILTLVRGAVGGGQFYECPRGHRYFISECGYADSVSTCPECHEPIGGHDHILISTNRLTTNVDTTETGYALGSPKQRETVPSTERDLSPPSCAIVRALMHCSLLWSSCTNENSTEGLLDLIKAQVRPPEMSMFFWQHLQHDIHMLSIALGKSKDDACLLMHLVLKNIATFNVATPIIPKLDSREHRTGWEKCFAETFIKPVLTNLDNAIQEAIHLQLNDKKEEHDRLFYVVHEKVQLPPNEVQPHLWSFRSRITLEHLLQILHTRKETYAILNEFLEQEPLLRATQYLPAIVKLHKEMYQLSHRRLDKKEVSQITIGNYIESLKQHKGLHNGNKRNLFQDKLNCLKKAWTLVKERLKDHARVPVDLEVVRTLTWDDSTPLSYLIPTLTGHGVCTVALVDLLVYVHNDFVEKCHLHLKNKQKKDILWKKHKVPASQIQSCHLLDYEHHILSIVLSHCHYSLEHGKGQDISYDLQALEKHIVDRFIHGKPLILLEVPQVVYRKDVYTAKSFASIRNNVKPQVKLSTKQQTDIVAELNSMQRLRECLDVVEIVIGFLSSEKRSGTANTELKSYLKNVLRMEKKFTSKKAMEYCKLCHILSLWETISVQIAKTLTKCQQEPFDSLDQDFYEKLQEEQEKELRSFLRGVDIPPFLNLFYEFIETNVRHREKHERHWPLRNTMYPHLESYNLEKELPKGFTESFPESITLKQSVATWKSVVFHQLRHEQEIINEQ